LDSRRGRLLPSIPVSVLILFVAAPAFADSIMIETDKEQYVTGDTVLVTGHVSNRSMPVIAMLVFDPDGEILLVDSIDIQSNGTFAKIVSLDSPFYDKTGLYLIAVEYINDSAFTIIEVKSNTTKAPPQPKVVPKVVELKTEKKAYYDNEFVAITGTVSTISESTVLIGIYNPDGSPAGFYVVDIGSNLKFSTSFLAKDGVNFKTVGKYSVKAHYANTVLETTFDFLGLPAPKTTQQESKNVPDEPKKIQTGPTIPQSQPQNTTPVEQPLTEPEQTDNLSIHDEELGRMLNDIMLNCDSSEFKDTIVYGNGMGPALMRLCKYEQAISYFDAMPNAASIIETYSNRGSALAKIGHYDAALDYYDAALDLDPDFAPALNNKANLMMQQGKISQAISMYDAALKSDPNNTVVKKNLEKAKIRQAELNTVETKMHNMEDAKIHQETSTEFDFALSEWKDQESTSTNIEAVSHDPEEGFFEKITSVFSTIGAALGFWR
jgi:hypothetical protein